MCDADTGEIARSGTAPHPDGTEVDPQLWWAALQTAVENAGGLDDVAAVSVGAQQHGMVCLDESGEVVRDALLWNDTRSSTAAAELVDELGGASGMGEAHRRGAGRRDHREQAALAGRQRTRTRRRDRRGVLAARLADVAAERLDRCRRGCVPTAATPAGPGTSRPRRTPTKHDLLELAMRGRRPGAADGARPARHRRPDIRAVRRSGRVRATTRPRRWVSAPNPATASSRSAPPVW